MTDNHTAIAVVLPVEFEGSAPGTHLTLMFLGRVEDAQYTKASLQKMVDRLRIYLSERQDNPTRVEVSGIEYFGREKNIPVMIPINSRPFQSLQAWLETYLAQAIGVEYKSDFPEYRPHVTMPRNWDGVWHPTHFNVGMPILWWGNDRGSNTLTGKKIVSIKKEHTVETHHHSRHIKLAKGPMMVTKKNVMGNRTRFRAKNIVITWREGKEPKELIIHGKTRGLPSISARRHYKIAKAPQWVKDLL